MCALSWLIGTTAQHIANADVPLNHKISCTHPSFADKPYESRIKNHRLLHFFHKLAGWIALTGVLTLAGAFACVALHFGTHLQADGSWLALAAIALLAGSWGSGWWVRRGDDAEERKKRQEVEAKEKKDARRKPRSGKNISRKSRSPSHQPGGPCGANERSAEASKPIFGTYEGVADLIDGAHHPRARSPGELLLAARAAARVALRSDAGSRGGGRAFVFGPVASAEALADVPSPEEAAIIIGGILLLGGALLVAWAEKALYSELAYQYGTMARPFEPAELRLTMALVEMKQQTPGSADYARVLADIQDFLYAVGKESLDENAEVADPAPRPAAGTHHGGVKC